MGFLEIIMNGLQNVTTERRYLRQHAQNNAASASGEEKSIGTGDRLSKLNQDVLVACVIPYLGIKPLAGVSRISRKLRDCVQEADKIAGKQLPSLRKAFNELIKKITNPPK